MNILERKEFINPNNPKKSGQTVIGVMSPLTRAMFTFLEGYGKEDFENAKCDFIFEGPFPCPGLEFSCLQKVAVEMDICPYAKSLQKFNEEWPMFAHSDFVRDFMHALISNHLPSAEKIIEGFNIVTTEDLGSQSPDFAKYEGWENMNLEGLMEVSIRGTLLESIAEIIAGGQFKDEDEKHAEDDVVIREMTSLEKAILTVININLEKVNPMINEHTKLLNGENFISSARPNISMESLLDGMAQIISIDMSGIKKGFEPKDKTHPDFLRVKELDKEIRARHQEINSFRNLMWKIIDMGINPTQKNGYDCTGIRAGFQLIVFNEN